MRSTTPTAQLKGDLCFQGLPSTGVLSLDGQPLQAIPTGACAYRCMPVGFVGRLYMIPYMHIKYLPLLATIDICWRCSQDKVDDVGAGIRSTALLFGSHTRSILAGLSATSMSLISCAGFLNHQGLPFYGGVGLATIQLGRVLFATDFESRASCWKSFVGCGHSGLLVWMGALADYTFTIAGSSMWCWNSSGAIHSLATINHHYKMLHRS